MASTDQRGRLNEKATTSTDRSRSRSRSAKATGDSEKRCSLSNRQHILKECSTFLKLSQEQREVEVTKRTLCKNCFSNAHNTARGTKAACKSCKLQPQAQSFAGVPIGVPHFLFGGSVTKGTHTYAYYALHTRVCNETTLFDSEGIESVCQLNQNSKTVQSLALYELSN